MESQDSATILEEARNFYGHMNVKLNQVKLMMNKIPLKLPLDEFGDILSEQIQNYNWYHRKLHNDLINNRINEPDLVIIQRIKDLITDKIQRLKSQFRQLRVAIAVEKADIEEDRVSSYEKNRTTN